MKKLITLFVCLLFAMSVLGCGLRQEGGASQARC